jgi:hypothetical protein
LKNRSLQNFDNIRPGREVYAETPTERRDLAGFDKIKPGTVDTEDQIAYERFNEGRTKAGTYSHPNPEPVNYERIPTEEI